MNITPRINLAIRPKEDASEFNISSNRLKEYCKSQELTPVFEVIKMLGPAHSREFIISCKVKDYATQGIDLLKKKLSIFKLHGYGTTIPQEKGNPKKLQGQLLQKKVLLLLEA